MVFQSPYNLEMHLVRLKGDFYSDACRVAYCASLITKVASTLQATFFIMKSILQPSE